ncbi:FAR-17a/AIG1-like protein domain-containing protein [Phthorimaea operculella]|nr:FAR-17a/AIG1-like protein domain-containing protein [Phthorimaea operculella]
MLLPLFHLSVVAINAYTLWYDQNHVKLPIEHAMKDRLSGLPFKGRYLFLTIWTLVLQTIYFTLALLNDLIGTNAKNPKKPGFIRTIKDTLFSLAFPAALFVTIAFWGIFAYDSELILPARVREFFPDWVNHVMHTTITVFIILESLLSPITYPSRKVGIPLGLVFIIAYVSLLATIFMRSGSLVYPVFDVMTVPMKVGFIASGALLGLFLYFFGELFNYLANPKTKESSGKSSSKTATKKKAKKT